MQERDGQHLFVLYAITHRDGAESIYMGKISANSPEDAKRRSTAWLESHVCETCIVAFADDDLSVTIGAEDIDRFNLAERQYSSILLFENFFKDRVEAEYASILRASQPAPPQHWSLQS